MLARFLFVEDDVLKTVGDLSGGEQCRLSLAKLVMTGPMLMALDEPTNHLDIDSCNALEAALREYTGTILVVSHDRYFLDSVVTRLVVLHDGKPIVHEGNYSYYIVKMEALRAEAEQAAREQEEAAKKERRRLERLARMAGKSRLRAQPGGTVKPPSAEELEERVRVLEAEIARVERLFADPATYASPTRSTELTTEHQALTEELEKTYDLWVEAEGDGVEGGQ